MTLCESHGLQYARLPCSLLPLEFVQTHVHWVSDAIQPSHPLLPPFPSAFNLSQHQSLFQWVDSLHQVAKYWGSFSFSISPSNEYSGFISFKIDWFDFLVIQVTLRSLIQHHSSKASIFWHSTFLMVQFSHPYMTTGKTIALTLWAFVSKVMSWLLNTLSRFVTAFLPRSKCLLISWLQSLSSAILEPKNIFSFMGVYFCLSKKFFPSCLPPHKVMQILPCFLIESW